MKTQSHRVIALASGLLFSSAALAQDSASVLRATSAPSVTFIGSGCEQNSGADTHWEGGTLVVNFGTMVAEKGAGISLLGSRKTCSVTLDLNVPQGLSYALVGHAAIGYDDLSASDTRTLTVTNFFQGQETTASVKSTVTGPRTGNYFSRHQNTAAETVWSPCNLARAHTITAAVRVGSGENSDVSSLSALDGLRLNFRVKPCN